MSEIYAREMSRMGVDMAGDYLNVDMWGNNERRYGGIGATSPLNPNPWGGGKGKMWGGLTGGDKEHAWRGEGGWNPALRRPEEMMGGLGSSRRKEGLEPESRRRRGNGMWQRNGGGCVRGYGTRHWTGPRREADGKGGRNRGRTSVGQRFVVGN